MTRKQAYQLANWICMNQASWELFEYRFWMKPPLNFTREDLKYVYDCVSKDKTTVNVTRLNMGWGV